MRGPRRGLDPAGLNPKGGADFKGRIVVKTLLKIVGWALAVVALLLVAGWFALKRPDIPYAELEAKYAVEGAQYADLGDDLRVRYLERGPADAPVILLLHGYTSSLESWLPWMKELATDHRVIAIDLPGHGLTRASADWEASPAAYAALVERFAAHRKLDKFVIAGESMGGWVAWEYALRHPERLNGLVLIDSSGWPDERPETKAKNDSFIVRALHNELGRSLLLPLDARTSMRNGLIASFEDDRLVTEAMIDRYAEMYRAPGHREILTDLLVDWDQWPMATPQRLAALRTPTLIMQGDKDLLVPIEHARLFDQAIPDSRLIIYQGVGHIPPEEAPARTAADVKAFLGALKLGKAAEEVEVAETPTTRSAEGTLPPATGPLDPSLIFE